MKRKADLNCVYVPSDDVVARVIEDELIIIPLVSGIADMEENLFTMNEAGKAFWDRMDGNRNLKEIVEDLSGEYEAFLGDIEKDILGLVEELLHRKIVVEA